MHRLTRNNWPCVPLFDRLFSASFATVFTSFSPNEIKCWQDYPPYRKEICTSKCLLIPNQKRSDGSKNRYLKQSERSFTRKPTNYPRRLVVYLDPNPIRVLFLATACAISKAPNRTHFPFQTTTHDGAPFSGRKPDNWGPSEVEEERLLSRSPRFRNVLMTLKCSVPWILWGGLGKERSNGGKPVSVLSVHFCWLQKWPFSS